MLSELTKPEGEFRAASLLVGGRLAKRIQRGTDIRQQHVEVCHPRRHADVPVQVRYELQLATFFVYRLRQVLDDGLETREMPLCAHAGIMMLRPDEMPNCGLDQRRKLALLQVLLCSRCEQPSTRSDRSASDDERSRRGASLPLTHAVVSWP